MEIIALKPSIQYSSCCYILISGKSFSVIDPSVGYRDALLQVPKLAQLDAGYVILTHAHVDHFWEISSYTDLGMKVLISCEDSIKLSDSIQNAAFMFPTSPRGYFGEYTKIGEGDTVDIGEDKLVVIKTPGHTSGSLCFIADNAVFTGDTLFEAGHGRCDLPTGDPGLMLSSLRRLFELPEHFSVYPGHGNVSTIGEAKFNFDY